MTLFTITKGLPLRTIKTCKKARSLYTMPLRRRSCASSSSPDLSTA